MSICKPLLDTCTAAPGNSRVARRRRLDITHPSPRGAVSPRLALPWFSWYCFGMEKTPFDLTPAQKGLLEALARETGKAIPALLDEALQVLQDQEQRRASTARRPSRQPPPARLRRTTRAPDLGSIYRSESGHP